LPDAPAQAHHPDSLLQRGADTPRDGAGRCLERFEDRRTDQIPHFSATKKRLQKLGSRVVDRPRERRFPTRRAASARTRAWRAQAERRERLHVHLETIIQAGWKNIALAHVPVRTNERLRDSRLFRNLRTYIGRSIATVVRIYAMY
jgi:hypothetical protein